jgi:KaiC/GvpD/RAD55 family RecA-like ATPase
MGMFDLPGERLSYYIRLIEEILFNNIDTLDEATLNRAKDRLAAMHPRLDELTLLESIYDFLKNLIGTEMANERLLDPLLERVSAEEETVERLGLHDWFPQFLLDREKAVDIGTLRAKSPMEQQVEIFSALFTEYLREVSRTEDASILIKNTEFAFAKQDNFSTMTYDSDDIFQLEPCDEDMEGQRKTLLNLFKSFVNLSAFTIGEEKAFERGVGVARDVLARFEEIPEKLFIADNILEGAIANRISTGMPVFDRMIEGGIPRGSSLLLKAPSGNESNLILNQFLRNGLSNSGGALLVLSTTPVSEFRTQMAGIDYDTTKAEKNGLLKVVDWYSWKVERVSGVEEVEGGAIVKSSKIISNLSIAINRALKLMVQAPTKRAVVKFLSPALNTFSQNEVYSFSQKLKARFKENDVTALFLIEKEAHDEGTIATFNEVFDSVVNLEKTRDGDSVVRKIAVESMSGTFFDTDYRVLEVSGNSIDVVAGISKEEEADHAQYEQAVDLLKKARAKVDGARAMDLDISGVEARFVGAKPLFHQKDYKGVMDIAQRCIDDVENLSKARLEAKATEEEKKLYSTTVEVLKSVRESMLKLKEQGADISGVEEKFGEARPALSNKDYETAMEVANACNSLLERITLPSPEAVRGSAGQSYRDEAIAILRKVRGNLKDAQAEGVDITKAENSFREGERALREDDYKAVFEIADRTIKAIGELKAEMEARKLEKGHMEARQAAMEKASDGIIALQERMLEVRDQLDAEDEARIKSVLAEVREVFSMQEYGRAQELLNGANEILNEVARKAQKASEAGDGEPGEEFAGFDFYFDTVEDSARSELEKICEYFDLSTEGPTHRIRALAMEHLLELKTQGGEGWEEIPEIDYDMIEDADKARLMMWSQMLGLQFHQHSNLLRVNLHRHLGHAPADDDATNLDHPYRQVPTPTPITAQRPLKPGEATQSFMEGDALFDTRTPTPAPTPTPKTSPTPGPAPAPGPVANGVNNAGNNLNSNGSVVSPPPIRPKKPRAPAPAPVPVKGKGMGKGKSRGKRKGKGKGGNKVEVKPPPI